MAQVAFNIGKEQTVVLTHPNLGPMVFALLTGFESRPRTTSATSTPITNNGESVHRTIYQGWEGSFEMDRTDNLVDAVIDYLESRYYAGEQESYFLITQTIRNPDGTVSDYRYRNVVLTPDTPGTWRGDEKVSQRITFMASRREAV